MSGFLALVRKEGLEIRRTWRLWVLPGLLIFFGVTSAIIADATPALIRSAASDQPGVVINLPAPVALDAYLQWVKSLQQIVLIALIIASADLIAGEKRGGTVILVVTKPISRTAFILAKVTAQLALLFTAAVAGTLTCWLGTRVIFGTAPVGVLLTATAIWFAGACGITGVMALVSVEMRATAGAAGIGIALYAALALAAAWGPARAHSPAGIADAVNQALHGRQSGLLWPVITSILLGGACLALAIARFRRQELAHATST